MKNTRQEVEEEIIGCILCDGADSTLKAAEIIDETNFNDPVCRIIFGISVVLASRRQSVDVLSVITLLKKNSRDYEYHLLKVGKDTATAIETLTLAVTDLTTRHARQGSNYDLVGKCLFLREETYREQVQKTIYDCGTKLRDGEDVFEVTDGTVQKLLSLTSSTLHLKSYVTLEDAFDEAIRETENELAGKVVRLSTGFPELDRVIYGLEKGRLYAVAAEEKIGKSLLSYQIGLSNAEREHATAIISLEMRASEIAKRFAGVNGGQDAQSRLNALRHFRAEIGNSPLFIRDGSASHSKVITLAHKLFAERKIELLIVDYLQLIELQGKDRVNEINDFVSKLKGLAMDLQIPIVLVAAVLNKQINNRGDRKPTPADIRDTGRLANDADCLLMLWKPDEQDESYLELFVARSRYSRLGKMGLCIDNDTLKLSSTPLREQQAVPLKQYQTKRF